MPTPTPATVAVIILTVDQRETTLRVLGSFAPDERRRAPFLVWDNGSTDGTAKAVAHAYPEVTVHWHAHNLGVASGRNAAAALAIERFHATHLLFLDNDMQVTTGFVEALLEPFARDPRVGQTQAKLRFLHDPSRINDGGGVRINFLLGRTVPVGMGEPDRGQFDQITDCVSCGGAMMVRVDVFRRLGGFDPLFDPFGPEDVDFSLRLQQLGYRALYVPAALAYHAVSHTYERGYTATYARAKAVHWFRFLGRHGSGPQKIGFALVGLPLTALRLTYRELRRGNPGAVIGSLRGVVDALRARSAG